jgi:hypothetical protein
LAQDGWTSAAVLHFDEPSVAAVSPVIVDQRRPNRVLSAGILGGPAGTTVLSQRKRKYNVARLVASQPLGASLAGGFFRKSALTALGGFDSSLGDAAAELDLACCLAELKLRAVCEPTSILLATEPVAAPKGTFADGRDAERMHRRHAFAHPSSAMRHMLRRIGEAAWSLVQPRWFAHCAGRLAGRIGSVRKDHLQRIARAKAALATETSASAQILPMRVGPGPARQSIRRAA